MFGPGITPKEVFLVYSTQFVFLAIRVVLGNMIMVVYLLFIYLFIHLFILFHLFIIFSVASTVIFIFVVINTVAFIVDVIVAFCVCVVIAVANLMLMFSNQVLLSVPYFNVNFICKFNFYVTLSKIQILMEPEKAT